ncbi:hypothetical protein PIB30_048658 [Stylosanthes scabra]|uniref:Glycosyl transferase CAP10 domain-containing protein n=1 Tax=Stylosanthes scabra TaxID=79078 RepID=A0ABU6XHE6_9FABA|nr:hypothetical protein [Stylosanthes scabra]
MVEKGNSGNGYDSSSSSFLPIMTRWIFLLFLIASILFLFLTTHYFLETDLSKLRSSTILKTITLLNGKPEFPLQCSNESSSVCNSGYPQKFEANDRTSSSCPEYFRWIHEDLKPWEKTGITRDMVDRGQNLSHFRLVIVNGKAYVEKYKKSFQTRDVFTIWGILQLLRLYPGEVPDLELMFQCGDKTVVDKGLYRAGGSLPPPIFHYCGDNHSYDIVFPDWTFWGWAELHISPWETTLTRIQQGNQRVKWKDRVPYAFWKGNPKVSLLRRNLCKCNVSDEKDWNARIYNVQWGNEKEKNFQDTKLEDQCTYRYKIYAEGATWSVSEKYIIACDSMTMFIEPRYFDFFSRSMVPLKHYWPITTKNMCEDIKFAVDWGNSHEDKAQEIGKGGTDYIIENLRMKYVYDYMLHVLKEYAKLQRFKPRIPEGGEEMCCERMACGFRNGPRKRYMYESLVTSPSETLACSMPPPYEPQALHQLQLDTDHLIHKLSLTHTPNNQ